MTVPLGKQVFNVSTWGNDIQSIWVTYMGNLDTLICSIFNTTRLAVAAFARESVLLRGF